MSTRNVGPWYSCNLGDAMLADEALEQIKHQFLSESSKGHWPVGTVVYFRHESEGRLHCEVKVYFPPETASLARKLGAGRCERPSPESLGVLISALGKRS